MSRLLRTIDLPLFVAIEHAALTCTATLLAQQNLLFRRALVIHGPGHTRMPAQRAAESLREAGAEVLEDRITGPTYDEVDRIKNEVIEGFFPDVLLAVGGGSVIDVVKLAASERRLAWLSVPTAVSNDGFCSPVVVLWTGQRRKSASGSMPIGVIADLDVLTVSPRRLRLAGVGDLISNLTACADWALAATNGKAAPNHLAKMLALVGARQVLAAPDPDVDDPAFVKLVLDGLVFSGVAMEVCGTSRPCSGAEHLISHALDNMGVSEALHGEQVGLATLFCMHLHANDVGDMRRFMGRLAMPRSPADLNLTREQFLAAVELAPSMRPGRWTILTECAQNRGLLEQTYDACFSGRD